MTKSNGFIVKTQVESANGAALRVERVTLSTNAQGLLRANSGAIQGAVAVTAVKGSGAVKQGVTVTASRK